MNCGETDQMLLGSPNVGADPWAFGWVAVSSIATVLAVAVSLLLLWLQRRDIADGREEARRRQALGVYLLTHVETEAQDVGYIYTDSSVTIFNHSAQAVTLQDCYVVHIPDKADKYWSPWRSAQTEVTPANWRDSLLQPGSTVTWPQPEGFHVEPFVGGSERIMLEFRDARGVVWLKRSDDTSLTERYSRQRWESRTSRIISKYTYTLQILLWWQSMRAIRRCPGGGPPASWRLYMWLTGGIGPEGDFPDPIHDLNPDGWPTSPPLRTTLFGLPPRQENDISVEMRAQWRQAHSPFDSATWPLGPAPDRGVLWSMLRDGWEGRRMPFPAVVSFAVFAVLTVLTASAGQPLWLILVVVALGVVVTWWVYSGFHGRQTGAQ